MYVWIGAGCPLNLQRQAIEIAQSYVDRGIAAWSAERHLVQEVIRVEVGWEPLGFRRCFPVWVRSQNLIALMRHSLELWTLSYGMAKTRSLAIEHWSRSRVEAGLLCLSRHLLQCRIMDRALYYVVAKAYFQWENKTTWSQYRLTPPVVSTLVAIEIGNRSELEAPVSESRAVQLFRIAFDLRYLGHSFVFWRGLSAASTQRIMAKVCHMLIYVEARVFQQWRGIRAAREHERRLIGGVVHRVRNRLLSMAFEKWQEYAFEIVHQAEVIRLALGRLMDKLLNMALGTWRTVAQEMRAQVRLVSGALQKMKNRLLKMVFSTWHTAVETQRYQDSVVQSTLKKMQNGRLWLCFQHWANVSREAKVDRFRMSGALTRMTNRKMSMAFER